MDDDVIAQLEAADAPSEIIEMARKRAQPTVAEFEVWPENWESLNLFGSMDGSWNIVAGMGSVYWAGIQYTQAESWLRTTNVPEVERPALMQDLRIMERAAKQVLNGK